MSTPAKFSAFRIRDDEAGYRAGIESMSADELSPGEILIRAAYSSVNYKDALAGTGKGKILRRFPLNGGIDVAGHVVASTDAGFREGDAVLCTGSGLSETRDGGYGEFVRLEARTTIRAARRAEPARKHDPRHGRLYRRTRSVPDAAERATTADGTDRRHRRDRRRWHAGNRYPDPRRLRGAGDHRQDRPCRLPCQRWARPRCFRARICIWANGRWRRPSGLAPSTTSAASCWPACRA